MTANAFPEDIHGCLEAGMNARVSKPIEMPIFEQAVRRGLGLGAGKRHCLIKRWRSKNSR